MVITFSCCLGKGCDFALLLGIRFVIGLGYQLFVRGCLQLVMWRGRFVFWAYLVF